MKNPNSVAIKGAFFFIFFLMLVVMINNAAGNETQVWIDRENTVKIFFTYSPENPVINTTTLLKFTAFNLLTGSHLKNLLAMVVIISNSGHEKILRFTNIMAPDSKFTLEGLFPELGVYHVITRLNSANPSSITLASFRLIVTMETRFLNIVITGIVILVIFGGVAYLVVIIVKKKAKKKILG